MNLKKQRIMAADLLKCGENRVWIDPDSTEEVFDAITRNDIRLLIGANIIQAKQKRGNSRGRIRYKAAQKKKGKRKGHGSRKGRKYARTPKKAVWIRTIRPLRTELKDLRSQGKIDKHVYRRYYLQAKGGMFRNRAHMLAQMEIANDLKGGSK